MLPDDRAVAMRVLPWLGWYSYGGDAQARQQVCQVASVLLVMLRKAQTVMIREPGRVSWEDVIAELA